MKTCPINITAEGQCANCWWDGGTYCKLAVRLSCPDVPGDAGYDWREFEK